LLLYKERKLPRLEKGEGSIGSFHRRVCRGGGGRKKKDCMILEVFQERKRFKRGRNLRKSSLRVMEGLVGLAKGEKVSTLFSSEMISSLSSAAERSSRWEKRFCPPGPLAYKGIEKGCFEEKGRK